MDHRTTGPSRSLGPVPSRPGTFPGLPGTGQSCCHHQYLRYIHVICQFSLDFYCEYWPSVFYNVHTLASYFQQIMPSNSDLENHIHSLVPHFKLKWPSQYWLQIGDKNLTNLIYAKRSYCKKNYCKKITGEKITRKKNTRVLICQKITGIKICNKITGIKICNKITAIKTVIKLLVQKFVKRLLI